MMGMQRVFIANGMREAANPSETSEISPLALTLLQARAYSRYRLLKAHQLIDMQEAKEFVKSLQLPTGALTLLKTTDIRSLNLQINNQAG